MCVCAQIIEAYQRSWVGVFLRHIYYLMSVIRVQYDICKRYETDNQKILCTKNRFLYRTGNINRSVRICYETGYLPIKCVRLQYFLRRYVNDLYTWLGKFVMLEVFRPYRISLSLYNDGYLKANIEIIFLHALLLQ